MASYIKTDNVFSLTGRLDRGEDLLESLTAITRNNGFILGRINAIGAVENAKVSFFDQKEKVYKEIALNESYELINLTGNISLTRGDVSVHAHVTLSDSQGRAFGGHLMPGTIVYACEFWISRWIGPDLKRRFDKDTGLNLWHI